MYSLKGLSFNDDPFWDYHKGNDKWKNIQKVFTLPVESDIILLLKW